MEAFVNTKVRRKDGTFDSYRTRSVKVKETPLPARGQTATGYGSRLPTRYMVKWNGRWYRVKVICFSNSGTAYIGDKYDECLTVSFISE